MVSLLTDATVCYGVSFDNRGYVDSCQFALVHIQIVHPVLTRFKIELLCLLQIISLTVFHKSQLQEN